MSMIIGSFLALAFAVFTAYRVTRPADTDFANAVEAGIDGDLTKIVALDAREDALEHPARREVFGIVLKGQTVAFVVDNDSGMAGYVDGLATIMRSVASAKAPRFAHLGVAVASDGMPLTFEPAGAIENAALGVPATLLGRVPTGRPDLNTALMVAANWRPDQLFLIVDRPLDPRSIEVLAQKAEQSGAETHVIALGAALPSAETFSSIAGRRGGRVKTFDDETFKSLVDFHRQLLAASEATIMKDVKR